MTPENSKRGICYKKERKPTFLNLRFEEREGTEERKDKLLKWLRNFMS